MYLAKRAKGVSPSLTLEITAKAKKMNAEGIDVVSFGAGEPDFNTPDYILKAGEAALNKGMTKYTPSSGRVDLRQAICSKLLKDNGLKYEPNDIVVSNGAKHSLYNAFAVILDAGDEVIIPSPYWLTYPELVKLCDGVPVCVGSTAKEGYKLTPAALEKAITPRTRAVVINNPGNPSGVVYSKAELFALAEVLEKTDIYIISDEIYEKLVYEGEFVSIASYSEKIKNQTVVINGVSKTYSMTGWRVGYTASCREVATAIDGMQSHMTSNANSIAQYATKVALENAEGEAFLSLMLDTFKKRREMIIKLLNEFKFTYIKPNGAFYVMLDVSEFFKKSVNGNIIRTALDFANYLLAEDKVAVVPCESFGADDFIRLSYAIGEKDIDRGIRAIKAFTDKLK